MGSFERIFLQNAPILLIVGGVWGTAGSQDGARLLQLAHQPEFCGSGFLAAVALSVFGHVFAENASVWAVRDVVADFH